VPIVQIKQDQSSGRDKLRLQNIL